MKKIIVWLAALFLLAGLALAEDSVASKADLNRPGRRIGVSQGSAAEDAVMSEFPEATIVYFTDNLLGYTAVAQGKLDAFVYDRVQMQLTIDNGLTGVHLLPEVMDKTVRIAVGYSEVSAIPDLGDQVNRFIAELKADGTLDDMYRRWVKERNSVMPEIPAPESPQLHLEVGTTGKVPPYSYYESDGLTGYDIELAHRFAAWLGADLSFQIIDFDGIIPAAKAGKIDVIMSNLQYLPERSESLSFSDILYEEKMGILVRDDSTAAAAYVQPEFTDFSQLSGKTVSMLTGAPFEELVKSKAPDVGEFTFFNTTPDMIQALKTQKTDAFLMNNAVGQLALNRNADLALFPQSLQDGAFGIAFAKGDPRRDDWQAAYDAIPRSEIEAAWEKWTGADDSVKTLPVQDWPGANGTVRVAACDTLEPMSYVGGDNELKGFDLEVILMMARQLDVRVEFTGMEFSAILAAVQSGKADLGAGSIIITEERAQAVDFVEYYPAAFVLIVRAGKAPAAQASAEDSAQTGIAASFQKTFIREDRWKLFAQGVFTTLLITLLTILFGTLLGFGVFMLCRNGNPVANLVTRFCLWLVQGMPMVVLLMILYYIIFGSVAINGVAVAVIGFTLTFGAAVFGLLKMGVGAVDNGQYEAAYALGYSNRRTFFKIILPQALPHVLPAYKGEIVGLIKATAIVGYIAVQDLTKMGDIVRSRTYEAFFPLIAVTIIYFVLEGLIGFLVSRISVNFNPKRRKPAEILKGVKTDD